MTVNAIIACDLGKSIGYQNGLPWPRNKEDMKWFRDHTRGHVVIMGRSTWESIGSKPLPDRINVVVTSKNVTGPDVLESGDMKHIIARLKEKFPGLYIWIMGGADVYNQAFPHCDKLYLTRFNRHYEADTFIDLDFEQEFPELSYQKSSGLITFEIREK